MMYPDTIAPDFSNRDPLLGVDPLILKRWSLVAGRCRTFCCAERTGLTITA